MHHFPAQDDTGACFGDLAFQETLIVLVVEELHVTRSTVVEPVLDRDVIDERLRLPVINVLAGRDASTQDNLDAVVVEPLGETERVVGTRACHAIDIIVVSIHAEADIHRLQRAAGNAVDLALQETVQGIAHIEIDLSVAAGRAAQIKAGYQHADRQFGSLF